MPKKKNLSIHVNGKVISVENRVVEYRLVDIVSLNSLIEAGGDFNAGGDSLEDMVFHAVMLDKLRDAIQSLSTSERELVYALFFSNNEQGMSERAYARTIGVDQKTIAYRRKAIFSKLKHFLQG